MALQKDITLASGVNLPTAFIKITTVSLMLNLWVEINVSIYKDQSAYNDGKPSVVDFTHKCTDKYGMYYDLTVLNLVNVNPIGQSYLYLKTLPFYASATDVLGVKG